MSKRAVSPVVGVVLLLVVTLVIGGTIGAVAVHSMSVREPKHAVIGVSATAATNRIAFTHRAGDSLDVDSIEIEVRVNGEPLAHQPPVPFFSADGFRAGPTGPFNSASDPTWHVGETASFTLAETNAPLLERGDEVTVRIVENGTLVNEIEATAR
ncbi:type IV pilin [Haladaptatus sp. R4]|uniref:type IV pilin n=1 Tax=Haladaptatus sp. R4 TaxID=1679489 RepID=UPI0007B4BBE3|nr:type IV pilin [Haladaptatus sp. R4]KZN25157.1 type IV pilin [Haladaptatus sp. R4]